MQKQLFHTTNPGELGTYFFGDRLLDFPKYLTFLMNFLDKNNQQVQFLQAFVHVESKEEEKDEVLTVETVFYNGDKTKIIRIWGAKDIESGVALMVTMEFINSETKQTEEEYIVIENDEEFYHEQAPEN
ncbi:hypothetical protein R4Z09_21915 [Niallia oryzisoli]|uniref:Uncharacterized protein n=1 Tax=Niallia oryzisoli TaxID=1737571 RepID=A0ABZ2C9V1_9BACI